MPVGSGVEKWPWPAPTMIALLVVHSSMLALLATQGYNALGNITPGFCMRICTAVVTVVGLLVGSCGEVQSAGECVGDPVHCGDIGDLFHCGQQRGCDTEPGCAGERVSCIEFTPDIGSCGAEQGCDWRKCHGSPKTCERQGSEEDCKSVGLVAACEWSATAECMPSYSECASLGVDDCISSQHCLVATWSSCLPLTGTCKFEESSCDDEVGCRWGGSCDGIRPCWDSLSTRECSAMGCYETSTDVCSALPSRLRCGAINLEFCESDSGCFVADVCGGTASTCDSINTELSCLAQSGCSWALSSGPVSK